MEKPEPYTSESAQEMVALRQALNADLRDSLPTIALIFGVLYTIFAVSHVLVLPDDVAVTMASVAATTAIFNYALMWTLRRRRLPPRWAHPVAAADTFIALANILLHLYLTADPLQTTNVTLLIIGVGFIVFSTTWWIVIVGTAVLGWGALVAQLGPDPTWQHFGFAVLSAVAASLLVHLVRRRTYVRIERLRIRQAQQQTTLEQTLRTAERAQRALETTVDVAQHITAILDLETLLNRVAGLIQEHYGYYFVGVFLLDKTGKYVVARAGTGEAGRVLCDREFRLAVGQEGVVGWAAGRREAVNVGNVAEDSRYVKIDETSRAQSELALPLEAAGEFLGILDIESDTIAAFDEDDIRVLKALAGQVAVAIQNATRYQIEQTRRQFTERLYDTGLILSRTLNLPDVLRLVLERLSDIVPFDRGSVMLDTGREVTIAAATGFPPASNPLNLHVPITENDVYDEIRRTQKPLLIPDVQQRADWQYVEDLPVARSWLGVPLTYKEDVIGMLSLTRERPDPYTDEEITLSSTFASQAAMALQNALLYENMTNINRALEDTVQQLKERSRDLEAAYSQLEHLDHTKSDFIRVASHELRTPLTVLRGYTRMLLEDQQIKVNAYHHQIVSGMMGGISRMEVIVGSILDMAKIDSQVMRLHPEPLQLALLVEAVRTMLSEACAARDLAIVVGDLSGLPPVEADAEAIRKVIYHLVANAVKYTPDGGTITISGRSVPASDVEFPGGGVEIVVSDTGIGIDPSAKELIFAKFYQTGEVAVHSSGTTKFKGGGPGLGLAIAKGIVEAHGGKIWAESPGYDEETCPGSHFHFILPLKFGALINKDAA